MERHVRAPFLSAAARPSVVLAVLLGGFGARLVCCTSLRLSLRKCSLTRRLWRWDAPRPVSLTRGFKGHTPFIRPVFETASAASCLCHQVRLGLLSGWTMNAWSRFARQKEERTSSALTRRFELRTTTPTASYCGNPSAPCLKAPEIIPSHAQAAARPPTHNSGGRAARLYSLCSVDFLPPSYSLDGRFEGPTPFIGQLALHRGALLQACCCAAVLWCLQ